MTFDVQSALAALGVNAGTVTIPTGTWDFDQTLRPYPGQNIVGQGGSVLRYHGAGNAIEMKWNSWLKWFALLGDPSVGGQTLVNLLPNKSENYTLRDLTLLDADRALAISDTYDTRIQGLFISNCRLGIHTYGYSVNNLVVWGGAIAASEACVKLEDDAGMLAKFAGGLILNNSVDGAWIGGAHDIVDFDGCYFEANSNADINQVRSASNGMLPQNVTWRACYPVQSLVVKVNGVQIPNG